MKLQKQANFLVRHRSSFRGKWKQRSTSLFLGTLVVGIVILFNLVYNKQQNELPRPYSSTIEGRSWYGISAYPELHHEKQAWQWLFTFLSSIHPESTGTIAEVLVLLNGKVTVIKFNGYCSSVFRDIFGKMSLETEKEIRTLEYPQLENTCSSGKCVEELKHRKQQTLSLCHGLRNTDATLFLQFNLTAIDAVDEVISNLDCAKVMVTIITTEETERLSRNRNFLLKLYDFLNGVFFTHHWNPKLTNFSKCEHARYNCTFWIVWVRAKDDPKSTWFPPAGDGSFPFELNRLRSFLNNPQTDICDLQQDIGGKWLKNGLIDGIKTVCLDSIPSLTTQDSCLIYSFGISNDWSFDDAMQSFGCSVYSFDPTINIQAHQRNSHHWFYPWGLSGLGVSTAWTTYSLPDIRAHLRHLERKITILKLDVEGAEWSLLNSTDLGQVLGNVEQIVVEVHPFEEADSADVFKRQSYLLERLERHGFRMFHSRRTPIGPDARVVPNLKSKLKSNQFMYELSFLKQISCKQ